MIKGQKMKTEKEILIKRIDELCKRSGLSYYTLSYKSGVPLSTLMHLMDGSVKNPRIYTIMKICAGMKITLAEFFDTDDFAKLMETIIMEE